MENFLNKLFNNRIIMMSTVIILVIIFFIEIIIGIVQLKEKRENEETTNNYVVYIKLNPLLKLEFSQTCTKKECDEPTVTKYELINEDAKKIYKNLDLLEESNDLKDTIDLICNTASNSKIVFDEVNIYTNWKGMEKYLTPNNQNSSISFNVKIDTINKIENIISNLDDKIKTYQIVFDSNGGSYIESQIIEENSIITEPTVPTKDGYIFIEWQLNNQKFDFNTKIKNNITLKAKWEKEEENTSNGKKEIYINKIELKNKNNNYSYNFVESTNIKVTLIANEDILNKINTQNIKLYVDVSKLELGEHNANINIDGIDSNITYALSSQTINIIVSEKN